MLSRVNAPPEARAAAGELVIPVLALLFTLYYFYSVHDAPWTAKVSTYLIGVILIGLVLVFLGLFFRRARLAGWRPSLLIEPRALIAKRLALLGLTIAYIVVLDWGGFTLSTFGFMFLAMWVLGGRRIVHRALLLSALCAVSGYVLFIAIFATRFPAGPFEQLMSNWLH